MNLVTGTKDWLTSSHILVPDDWLQACIEWIQEENQGSNITQEEINSLVYEQWLLADLHELETQCLPAELVGVAKYQLTGAYALQIDSIVDVGKSFYSQQQKIKGTENENAKVSADEPNQKPWEQKPTRMLMFNLTDGKVAVRGMEYKPISCLNPQSAPGTKILVYGSVLCRHGILMLGEDNIKFMGGEVDTLVEANTVSATLQSAMVASQEDGGKQHRQEFRGSDIRHSQKPVASQQGAYNPSAQRNTGGINRTGNQLQGGNRNTMGGNRRDPKPGNQQWGKMKSEPQSQNIKSSIGRNTNFNQSEQQLEDEQNYAEFYDAFMDDMEVDDFDEPVPAQQPPPRNHSGNNKNIANSGNGSTFRNNNGMRDNSENKVKIEQASKTHVNTISTQAGASEPIIQTDGYGCSDMDFDDDDDFPSMEEELEYIEKVAASLPDDKVVSSVHTNQMNTAHAKTSLGNIGKTTDGQNQISSNSMSRACNKESRSIKTSNKTIPTSRNKSVNVKTEPVSGKERACAGADPTIKRPGTMDSFFAPVKKIKEEAVVMSAEDTNIQSEYPFTYLAKIMSLPVKQQPTFHTVKAYISTLTSKLSTKNETWTLSCKINDGTMAVDVDISNQVLTEMIGFSPKEAQEMKQRIPREPSLKKVLTEGISQFQQKLIELMCLLELQISSQNPRPVIVAVKQVTSNHIDMLYNRVMANWGKFNGN